MLRNATFFRFFRKFGKLVFDANFEILDGCGYCLLAVI